jgi:hypothetical protein
VKFYGFSLSTYCFVGRFRCMGAWMEIGCGLENSDIGVYPLWK